MSNASNSAFHFSDDNSDYYNIPSDLILLCELISDPKAKLEIIDCCKQIHSYLLLLNRLPSPKTNVLKILSKNTQEYFKKLSVYENLQGVSAALMGISAYFYAESVNLTR